MSKQLEMEAESVDAAIDIACAELGVSRDDVKIKILADGKKKIPGVLGPIQARVRVTVRDEDDDGDDGPEIEEEPPAEARGKSRGKDRGPSRSNDRGRGQDRGGDRDGNRSESRDKSDSRDQDGNRDGDRDGNRSDEDEAPAAERSSRGREGRRSEPRRDNRDAQASEDSGDGRDSGDEDRRRGRRGERDDQPDTEDERIDASEADVDIGEEGAQILERILDEMGLDGEVDIVDETDEGLTLEIEGDDGALLIGKHGQTLDAIQYVVNRLVGKTYRNAKRITVDTERYRARREESLREMALDIAERVVETRRSITLNPMSARERRIVHMALKDNNRVETRSVGRDDERKLVISPRGAGRGRGDDRSGGGGGGRRRGRRNQRSSSDRGNRYDD